MTKMKLSEMDFESVVKALKKKEKSFYMHYDASDEIALVVSQKSLETVKDNLRSKYGDVEVELYPEAYWSRQVTIKDEKFQKDLDEYYKRKSAWCAKYGCD